MSPLSPFTDLWGQPQAVALLEQAVSLDRVAPAYLFVGPSGVGRRLAARCFVQLLCNQASSRPSAVINSQLELGNHPDVLWVEPTYVVQNRRIPASQAEAEGVNRKTPPQIRLEQIREISRFLGRSPLVASRNVVVMEQVETMAEGAANGLLKTLEEPGQATLLLLAPTLESLLPTIVSRCQRIPFYRLSEPIVAKILTQQGRGDLLDNSALLKMAEGSPGEAIVCDRWLQTLPAELLALAEQLPRHPRQALTIAKQLAQALEVEAQIWFLGYLQHCHWNPQRLRSSQSVLQRLEQARLQLQRSVNPRLVWEVLLLELSRSE